MQVLGDVAYNLLRKANNVPFYAEIFLNWENVVGEEFSQITKPIKVRSFKGEEILILQVSRAHSIELQHSVSEILQMVNEYLGKKYFSQIKIRI